MASFLDVMWRALLFDSSTLALCSHPTADELSPRARMQERGGVESCCDSIQIVMTAARNSSRLFFKRTESLNFSGIAHLHASPDDAENPPRPLGHASEKVMWVGLRYVRRFMLIPWCIFGRKTS